MTIYDIQGPADTAILQILHLDSKLFQKQTESVYLLEIWVSKVTHMRFILYHQHAGSQKATHIPLVSGVSISCRRATIKVIYVGACILHTNGLVTTCY